MSAESSALERKNTWIDAELIKTAKVVAAHERVTLAEVLERHIRPGLARDMAEVAAKFNKTAAAGA